MTDSVTTPNQNGNVQQSPLAVKEQTVADILTMAYKQIKAANKEEVSIDLCTSKVEQWNKILQYNLFETPDSLKEVSAAEWFAMGIPVRIRSNIRQIINKRKSTQDHEMELSNTNSSQSQSELPRAVARRLKRTLSSPQQMEAKLKRHSIALTTISKQSSNENILTSSAPFADRTQHYIDLSSNSTAEDEADKKEREKKVIEAISSPSQKRKKLKRSKSQLGLIGMMKKEKEKERKEKEKEKAKDKANKKTEEKAVAGRVNVIGDKEIVQKLFTKLNSNNSEGQQFCVTKKAQVQGELVDIVFFDNSSEFKGEAMDAADIILLVFSVIDTTSLNNIITEYLPKLKVPTGFPAVPILFVGVDSEEREEGERKHVTISQAMQVKHNFQAFTYLEALCSEKFNDVVMECARAIASNKKLQKHAKYSAIQGRVLKTAESNEHELSLTKLKLDMVPIELAYLKQLQKLRLSHNCLRYLPLAITQLAKLQELYLDNNMLVELSPKIQMMTSLIRLDLENNKLDSLPLEALKSMSLEEVKIKGNPLQSIPKEMIKKKTFLILSEASGAASPSLKKSAGLDTTKRRISLAPEEEAIPLFNVEVQKVVEYERKKAPYLKIPSFLRCCLNFILTAGLALQGIFRLEGNSNRMNQLKEQFETGELQAFDKFENPNNITGLLKLWLRSMPIPVMISQSTLVQSCKEATNDKAKIDAIRSWLELLPEINRNVTAAIFRVLFLTAYLSEINKMDELNLARVMATNMVWDPKQSVVPSAEMLQEIQNLHELFAFIIEFYPQLFEVEKDPFSNEVLSAFKNPFTIFDRKLIGKQRSLTSVQLALPATSPAANAPQFKRLWVSDEKGIINIWNAEELFCVREIDVQCRVNSMLGVNDRVWIGTIKTIQIRNAGDGELIKEISVPGYTFVKVNSTIWTSIWTGDSGQIRIYSISGMKMKKEFEIASRITALIHVGDEVWGACQDKKLRIWNMEGKELCKLETPNKVTGNAEKPNAMCFAPATNSSEATVWVGCEDAIIYVWDVKEREIVARLPGFHASKVTGLTAVGDRIWSCSWNSNIHVWDIDTKQHFAKIDSYHNQPMSGMVTDWKEGLENWRVYTISYDHTTVVHRCRAVE